jgi:hypothetical protein
VGGNPNGLFPNIWGFVGPTVAVTVANGQRVYVSANKYMGSSAGAGAGGVGGLDTAICIQPQGGGALQNFNIWMGGGSVPANTRVPWGASVVWTGVGSWNTGLCARSSAPANWNYNEWGYTSALVFQP